MVLIGSVGFAEAQEVIGVVAVPTPASKAVGDACVPVWPAQSVRNYDSGTVFLRLLVNPDGLVKETTMMLSSGYPDLDKATIEAVSTCRFAPALEKGVPIETRLVLTHKWVAGEPATALTAGRVCAKPVYPKASLRAEQQGVVALAFLIGADGAVLDSRIEKSSGFSLLDEAAREGLAKCYFKPQMENGKLSQTWFKVKYTWSLE
jgi:TonB family protein